MLRAALAALGKQRKVARSRPEWWTAFRQAEVSWKNHYARKLAWELRRRTDQRQLSGSVMFEFAAMLRLAPIALVRAMR